MSILNKNKGRREFLADCGKMSGIGAMSSMLNLTMMNNVAAQNESTPDDYKGLVCVYLGGGNDSYNMLRPGRDNYQGYLDVRAQLSIAQNDNDRVVDVQGNDYHVHPNMPGVRNMFNNGDLSFVGNIGTLVEPVTRAQFDAKSRQLPRALGSHFDQTAQWNNSLPNVRGGSLAGQGWIGRMSEVLNESHNLNPLANVNMNIRLGGSSLAQTSESSGPLIVNPAIGANAFDIYKNDGRVSSIVDTDIGRERNVESQYRNLTQWHYSSIARETIEANNDLAEQQAGVNFQTTFPNTGIGRQLERVAQYIVLQESLGLNRQTFFVSMGGFDLHAGLLSRHGGLLTQLSQAMTAFNAALKEKPYSGGGTYHDRVVTYTASDFGRNLRSNGRGSDHGWGSVQMVMGGPIQGQRMLGRDGGYPEIELDAEYVLSGSGRVLPATSIDDLYSTIAYWFGVENNAQMETMLPNIRNFWAAGANNPILPNMFKASALVNRKIT